jgi:hypothetical protein
LNNNNNNNNNNNVLNQNNNNNINNKVSIISTAPVTSRTTRKVNVVESKIPGTIHAGTTKYAATENHIEKPLTRSKISITHGETSTALPLVLELSSSRPNISVAHELLRTGSKIVIPNVTKPWQFSSTRSNISIAHEETRSKYTATENQVTSIPSTRSKISIAHEEASTAVQEFSSTRPYISVAHEEASTAIPTVLNHRNFQRDQKFQLHRN